MNFFFFGRTLGDSRTLQTRTALFRRLAKPLLLPGWAGGLGRSLTIFTTIFTTLSDSFLQTLNVGDRHGARDPLAECPGEDLLSNFLHFNVSFIHLYVETTEKYVGFHITCNPMDLIVIV